MKPIVLTDVQHALLESEGRKAVVRLKELVRRAKAAAPKEHPRSRESEAIPIIGRIVVALAPFDPDFARAGMNTCIQETIQPPIRAQLTAILAEVEEAAAPE